MTDARQGEESERVTYTQRTGKTKTDKISGEVGFLDSRIIHWLFINDLFVYSISKDKDENSVEPKSAYEVL